MSKNVMKLKVEGNNQLTPIDEAAKQLEKLLSAEEIYEIRNIVEEFEIGKLHFTVGLFV